MIDENDEKLKDIESITKNILSLEDQNNNLEGELDKFLVSDNLIRTKLKDRNRSPLRVNDLCYTFDEREQMARQSIASAKLEHSAGRYEYIQPVELM